MEPSRRAILLVEDDPADELLTIRAFERSHIVNAIDVVRDGQQALDYLFGDGECRDRDSNDMPPQVVLLDLKLPKVNGLDVLRRIRGDERLRTLPVVILTSSSEESDIVTSYDLGANSYVRKPVDFAEFASAVRDVGLYWMMLNEPPPLI